MNWFQFIFYPTCRPVLNQSLMHPEAIYELCALTKLQLTYVVRQLAGDWTASLCLPKESRRFCIQFCIIASKRHGFIPSQYIKSTGQPATHSKQLVEFNGTDEIYIKSIM